MPRFTCAPHKPHLTCGRRALRDVCPIWRPCACTGGLDCASRGTVAVPRSALACNAGGFMECALWYCMFVASAQLRVQLATKARVCTHTCCRCLICQPLKALTGTVRLVRPRYRPAQLSLESQVVRRAPEARVAASAGWRRSMSRFELQRRRPLRRGLQVRLLSPNPSARVTALRAMVLRSAVTNALRRPICG